MSTESLKEMKHSLMSCVQGQMSDLKNTDAHELGEAIDMIKDLSEAIYYCTVTEAMEQKAEEKQEQPINNINYYTMPTRPYNDGNRYYNGDWYENWQPVRYMGPDTFGRIGDSGYYGGNIDDNRHYGSGSTTTTSTGTNMGRSYYEDGMNTRNMGMSPNSRRMYIEAKDMHKGSAVQMQELENYMKDLSKDITDMIQDSTPEEKLLLQQKLLTLANKIKPNNVSN